MPLSPIPEHDVTPSPPVAVWAPIDDLADYLVEGGMQPAEAMLAARATLAKLASSEAVRRRLGDAPVVTDR